MKLKVLILSIILTLTGHARDLVATKSKLGTKLIYEYSAIFYLNLAAFPALEDRKKELTKEQYEFAWRSEQNQALFFSFLIYLDRATSSESSPDDDLGKIYKSRTEQLLKNSDWNSFLKYVETAGKIALKNKGYFENYDMKFLDEDILQFHELFKTVKN